MFLSIIDFEPLKQKMLAIISYKWSMLYLLSSYLRSLFYHKKIYPYRVKYLKLWRGKNAKQKPYKSLLIFTFLKFKIFLDLFLYIAINIYPTVQLGWFLFLLFVTWYFQSINGTILSLNLLSDLYVDLFIPPPSPPNLVSHIRISRL